MGGLLGAVLAMSGSSLVADERDPFSIGQFPTNYDELAAIRHRLRERSVGKRKTKPSAKKLKARAKAKAASKARARNRK